MVGVDFGKDLNLRRREACTLVQVVERCAASKEEDEFPLVQVNFDSM